MPLASYQTSVPVVVDDAKCIADKGCTVCVDVCPLDVLRISEMTGKAYMAYDECWYCMPCEADCPTGAVKVNIPYLLRGSMPELFEAYDELEEFAEQLKAADAP